MSDCTILLQLYCAGRLLEVAKPATESSGCPLRSEGVRTWVQPGFELFFSFIRVQTRVQLGFELFLEEFELFQGLERFEFKLGLNLSLNLTWLQMKDSEFYCGRS